MHLRKRCHLLCFLLVSFIGCEELTNEENLGNDSVMLIAPSVNSILDAGDVRFDWHSLEGASFYRLQIATPDFASPEQVVWDELVQDSVGTNSTVRLEAGRYEWRVRAENGAYQSPFSSAVFEVQ
jgi:hypothetical protein